MFVRLRSVTKPNTATKKIHNTHKGWQSDKSSFDLGWDYIFLMSLFNVARGPAPRSTMTVESKQKSKQSLTACEAKQLGHKQTQVKYAPSGGTAKLQQMRATAQNKTKAKKGQAFGRSSQKATIPSIR